MYKVIRGMCLVGLIVTGHALTFAAEIAPIESVKSSVKSTDESVKSTEPLKISDFGFGQLFNDGFGFQLKPNVSQYSGSKNEVLCWSATVASQRSEEQQVTAVEVFESEKTTVFTSEENDLNIVSAKNGRQNTITRHLTVTTGDEVGACWTMAAEDPLGKVTLRVSIDGVKQKPIRYTIIK